MTHAPTDAAMYLRADVVAEPLVDRWHAWSHLLAPATASRNLTHRHLPIIESYLAAPAAHARAARSPALAGGPFMDLDGDRSAEIEELRERTTRHRASLVELSGALDDLDELLAGNTPGASLEDLYPRVPAPLRGYVELVYDLRDQPGFRLIEALLYHSAFGDAGGQAVALSLAASDDRPFALSTPRLDSPGTVVIPVPFRHGGLDALFSAVRSPATIASVADALELPAELAGELPTFFTATAPRDGAKHEEVAKGGGRTVRVRYFGHACVLVEMAGGCVLVDPLLPPSYAGAGPRLTEADLPPWIDHILVTHGHQDHLVLEALLRLRHRTGTIVVPRSGGGALQDPSLRLALRHAGFPRVVELDEMDELETAGGRITALPFLGEHGDLAIAAKTAWRIEANGRNLVFAADSADLDPDLYAHIHRIVGDVDGLFLGMECEGAPLTWLYGPLYRREPPRELAAARRLAGSDDRRGLAMIEALGCPRAYVYAMGHEPWVRFLTSTTYRPDAAPVLAADRLIDACRDRDITAERLMGSRDLLF